MLNIGAAGTRDNYVLGDIITKYVAPGANLVTDAARAYPAFMKREGVTLGYKHFVVVHTENFLNPSDKSIHTQNCDGRFGHMKIRIRGMRGVPKIYFQEHLWFQSWVYLCTQNRQDIWDIFIIYLGIYLHDDLTASTFFDFKNNRWTRSLHWGVPDKILARHYNSHKSGKKVKKISIHLYCCVLQIKIILKIKKYLVKCGRK